MLASDVLSTFPKPTIPLLTPPTVPVNVGEARLAFKSNAVCVAVDIGLFASLVLSTFPSPTSPLTKVTTPVLPATEVTKLVLSNRLDKSKVKVVASSLVKVTIPNPSIVPLEIALASSSK